MHLIPSALARAFLAGCCEPQSFDTSEKVIVTDRLADASAARKRAKAS
jgi:hypothetical protein